MSAKTDFVALFLAELPATYSNALPVRSAIKLLAEAIYDANGTLTPADLSVTNAKLATVATQTFKGRTTAATGAPEDLTTAQASALLLKETANVVGNTEKTAYNKLAGYTKVDNRPTGGATNNYALQVRSESGNTSGQQWGIDCEAHLKATGTAGVIGTQGVAAVDATFTATDSTLIGVYGQVRSAGTIAGNSFMAGLYGLVEDGGGAITAAHVAALWLDTHQAAAVTGSYQMMYITENGATALDQVMYLRTPAAAAFAEFEQCDTFVSNTIVSGAGKKIKITIDGVAHYINAHAS